MGCFHSFCMMGEEILNNKENFFREKNFFCGLYVVSEIEGGKEWDVLIILVLDCFFRVWMGGLLRWYWVLCGCTGRGGEGYL